MFVGLGLIDFKYVRWNTKAFGRNKIMISPTLEISTLAIVRSNLSTPPGRC